MPRLKSHIVDATPERPPIWVEGTQRPKFRLAPWGRVGYRMTTRWLAPKFERSAASIAGFGARINEGRYPVRLNWLGKAQRFVPSRQTVGGLISAFAARISEAQHILAPTLAPAEPLSYPNLIRPDFSRADATARLQSTPQTSPRPEFPSRALQTAYPVYDRPDAQISIAHEPPAMTEAQTADLKPQQTGDDAALAAIRAIMQQSKPHPVAKTVVNLSPAKLPSHLRTGRRAAALLQPLADPLPNHELADQPGSLLGGHSVWGLLLSGLHLLAAHAIAWTTVALILPVGLAHATLHHLNGGDLSDWD